MPAYACRSLNAYGERKMNVLDYGQSFLAGKAAWNSVRFWVESRTRLIDDATGRLEDYYQCASCKSEDTFAEKDLFYADNYDFVPIFGPEFGVVFRRCAYLNDNYRSCVKAAELWEGQAYHLVERPDARLLETTAAIREATAGWQPLVARTEIWHEESRLRAVIEYPIKTINIHHERDLYQVDTGPLALPDLAVRHEPAVEGFSLAFVAFNAPQFADFVIEEPTRVKRDGQEPYTVYHYSRRLSLAARNTVYALPA